MTWKEFKEWAEKKGIKDNDEIRYIDFDGEPEKIIRNEITKDVDEVRIT